MKKQCIMFLLTMLMSLMSVKTSAHDIEVANAEGVTIYYTYINNNAELAVSYRGSYFNNYSNEYSGSVVIPESVTYNGTTHSVTRIDDNAFSSCSGLTSVTIPNSVTSIGIAAFSGCSGLTNITIPNSVTSVGYAAFSSCSGLTSIQVSGDNRNYDSRDGCNAIIETASNTLITGCKNTTIPNSVTSIGEGAFSHCSGLTSITIPNSIIVIGRYAFEGCSGLTSIAIPNSVISIGYCAFYNCSGLTSIQVAGDNRNYDSRDGCNAIIETASNTLITGCKNTIIPNSVISIDNYAFHVCNGLTSVTIPNSVTSIGFGAFSGCSGLTNITIPNSMTSIREDAFQNCI